MKMGELRELLDGYSDDAEVLVVDRSDPHVNRYYSISGLEVRDWGTRFEIEIGGLVNKDDLKGINNKGGLVK